MLKRVLSIITSCAILMAMPVNADTVSDAQIKANISKLGVKVDSVSPSAFPNVFEVLTSEGLYYTNNTGEFLIDGKMFKISSTGLKNMTEESLKQVRLDGMDQFKDSMIVYPAKNAKHTITVFTDLTCGYCRKLHAQIDGYNDLGITVQYLAFPRAGIHSKGYSDIRSVWCSDDPKTALTDAKSGSKIKNKTCGLPVADQYGFGKQAGVTGTPAIIFEDGSMLPGYRTPEQIDAMLDALPKS